MFRIVATHKERGEETLFHWKGEGIYGILRAIVEAERHGLAAEYSNYRSIQIDEELAK